MSIHLRHNVATGAHEMSFEHQTIHSRKIDRGEGIRSFTRPGYAQDPESRMPLVFGRARAHHMPLVQRVQRPKHDVSYEELARLGERSEYALAPDAVFLQ